MLYPSTEGYNMITHCRVRYDTIVNCSLLSVAEVELRLFIDNWFVRQEDDSDCGGGTCLSPCLWPMLGLQLLLLWLITSSQHSWPLHRDTHSLIHRSSFQFARGQKPLQLCHPGCMQNICDEIFSISISIFQCQRVLIHFLLVTLENGDTFTVLSCTHSHDVLLNNGARVRANQTL